MEIWSGIRSIVCLSFWTLFHLSIGSFTKYHLDEANADKLCLADSATIGVLVVNLLACLATCSRITECRSAIYHKGSRTCYKLLDGYRHLNCTMDLVGARLYRTGCPSGWKPGNKSCYRFTGQVISNHSESEAICKGFSDKAHLADIKTEEEYKFINNLYKGLASAAVWTGATYNNGWTWSDGTTVDYWPQFRMRGGGKCIFLYLRSSTYKDEKCNRRVWYLQGLCEL